MCSIFAVVEIKADAVAPREKALEILRLMHHRRPDRSRIYTCEHVVLAHEHFNHQQHIIYVQ